MANWPILIKLPFYDQWSNKHVHQRLDFESFNFEQTDRGAALHCLSFQTAAGNILYCAFVGAWRGILNCFMNVRYVSVRRAMLLNCCYRKMTLFPTSLWGVKLGNCGRGFGGIWDMTLGRMVTGCESSALCLVGNLLVGGLYHMAKRKLGPGFDI